MDLTTYQKNQQKIYWMGVFGAFVHVLFGVFATYGIAEGTGGVFLLLGLLFFFTPGAILLIVATFVFFVFCLKGKKASLKRMKIEHIINAIWSLGFIALLISTFDDVTGLLWVLALYVIGFVLSVVSLIMIAKMTPYNHIKQ